MKKILIAALLFTFSQTSFSQINQGQWLLGGSAGFESGKFGDVSTSKFTSVNFSPDAGYFFIHNLAGGLRVNIQSTKFKDEDASSSLLFAPFVRYYFLPVAQQVNIFADASYGFGSSKDGGSSQGFNQYSIAAGPAIFLTPHSALEFTLQYRSMGGDAYGGNDRQKNFGVNVGFQIHLGK
jgi:hypothetical protein